jgi:hypothetical protein
VFCARLRVVTPPTGLLTQPRDAFNMSRIAPKLYIGSEPPRSAWVGENFALLVLCAVEIQPGKDEFPGLVSLGRVPLRDHGTHPRPGEFEAASRAAGWVSKAVAEQRRTLVTCAMGINRSALVTALALMRLFGLSGPEATTWVRMARPGTLTNRHFAAHLAGLRAPRALLPNPQGAGGPGRVAAWR